MQSVPIKLPHAIDSVAAAFRPVLVVFVAGFLMNWYAVPVAAGMICDYSDWGFDSDVSLDTRDDVGKSRTRPSAPIVTAQALRPKRLETCFADIGAKGFLSEAGSCSASSIECGQSLLSTAILGRPLNLPEPKLMRLRCSIDPLDIPGGLPFELLRPPQGPHLPCVS